MTDRVRLVELLLQRSTSGKEVLLNVLKDMTNTNYNSTILPTLEIIFDKLNVVYE